jgi:hypothetical protein
MNTTQPQNGRLERVIKQVVIAMMVTLGVLGIQQYGNMLMPHMAFGPHGMCYMWYKPMIIGQVVADALIFAAYTLIPATLIFLIRKSRALPLTGMFWGFTLFIFFCGLTHLMEIITVWHPLYWCALAVKTVTAVASVPTALYLAKIIPQLLATAELRRRTEELSVRVEKILPEEGMDRLRELCSILEKAK